MKTTEMNRARVTSAVSARPEMANPNIIERNGRVFKRADPTEEGRDFDMRIVPDGMVYQFNRFETLGMTDVKNQTANASNGWLPVPSERHDGVFMPPGYKGDIIKGDLRLEERPIEYELADRARLKKGAYEWATAARERFKLDALPAGFTTETPKAKASNFIQDSNEVEALPASNTNAIPIAD